MWRQKERESRGTEQTGWVHEADRPAEGHRANSMTPPDKRLSGPSTLSLSSTIPIWCEKYSKQVTTGEVLQGASGSRGPDAFVL